MAVVVGPPDVDGQVERPLLQLVAVVGDVGSKVGVKAVGPAEYVIFQVQPVHLFLALPLVHVLLFQQFGGIQPQGAVLLIGPALVGEQLYGTGHKTPVVEPGFHVPLVVLNAILF